MKTYKELLESININEKSAEFLRLNFKDNKTVKKVDKWVYKNISQSNSGFMSMIPDESGNSIEWEDIDDADELMSILKKAGFKFKVDMRESADEEELLFTKEEIALYELEHAEFLEAIKKKSASDRKQDAKKRKKWAKTAGGKKSAKKSKKHADKVAKGTVKVDKKKSKLMKKVKKVYK
jgi:hypothetical protein